MSEKNKTNESKVLDEQIDSRFVANPHALVKDGVVTEVVFMQDYTPQQIAETLSKYSYDEVIRWEDYGAEIYVGYTEHIRDSEIYYAPPQPYPSWIWDKNSGIWACPVEHPWTIERRTNPILRTEYEWDEELLDWAPKGELSCCED